MAEVRVTPAIAEGLSIVFDDDHIKGIEMSRGIIRDSVTDNPEFDGTFRLVLRFAAEQAPHWADSNGRQIETSQD
jgi:hypothetical protein